MARRQLTRGSFDSINITSLIDTLFFLLIIFMLTAPLLENSIDVSPPKMNANEIDNMDDKSKVINLKADGSISMDRKTLTMSELADCLQMYEESNTRFFLRADKSLAWGDVVEVLKELKNRGFKEIYLITEAEK